MFTNVLSSYSKTKLMGYTHYWDLKNATDDFQKQFRIVVSEVTVLKERLPEHSLSAGGYYKDEPLKIFGSCGKSKPEITNDHICFNGDARNDLWHEDFYLGINSRKEFNFCKTARKPYDFFVCLVLISAANHIDGFEFSSDGGYKDWAEVLDFYKDFNDYYISDNLKLNLIKNFPNYNFDEIQEKVLVY